MEAERGHVYLWTCPFYLWKVFTSSYNCMKRLHLKFALISFVLVMVACAALSITAAAENDRWAAESVNPLNGIESIAFVVSYFSGAGGVGSYAITGCLLFLFGCGIYLTLSGITKLIKKATRR